MGNSKTLKTVLAFVFSLALVGMMFLLSACGEGKIVSIDIKEGTLETTILKGATLDTDNLIIEATYENESTKEFTNEEFTLGTIDTSEIGKKNLQVTIGEASFNIQITVVEIASIDIEGDTLATTLKVGETLSTANFVASVGLFDGEDVTYINVPASELTIGNIDTTTAGAKQLSVTYKGFTDNITITVIEPVAVNFMAGYNDVLVLGEDTLNLEDMTLVFTYSDDSLSAPIQASTLTNNASSLDFSTVGEKSISFTFENKQFQKSVYVATIESLTLDTESISTIVLIDTDFEDSDISVEVAYNYGGQDLIRKNISRADLILSTIDTSTTGDKQLEIEYKGTSIFQTITVVGKVVQSLSIDPTSLSDIVCVGNTPIIDTIQVTVIYEHQATPETLTIDDISTQFSGPATTVGETITLTVTHSGATTTYEFEVVALEYSEMEVVAGTFENQIALGSNPDTSNLQIKFTAIDGIEKIVNAADLTIGTINNLQEGNHQLQITYNGQNFYIPVTVIAQGSDLYKVTKLSSQLVIDYENALLVTQGNTAFTDREQPLYAGDDNIFDLRISAEAYEGEEYGPFATIYDNLDSIRTIIEVKMDDSQTPLTGNELAAMVAIDTLNATLDFTENAIGHKFSISVQPFNMDEEYIDSCRFTAVVEVIDGYNVYDAKGLSVLDNYNRNSAWNDYKTANGLLNVDANAIILQNDISVTAADLPASYFWKTTDSHYEEINNATDLTLAGSLIDDRDYALYMREVADGQDFKLIGNYFNIDASQVPLMIAEDESLENLLNTQSNNLVRTTEGGESYMTGHTCLIYTFAHGMRDANVTAGTKMSYINVQFSGNGTLSDDARNSGALLLMKNIDVNCDVYNNIVNNFYITFYMEDGELDNPNDGNFLIEKTKAFNSFQCLLYFWGAEHCVIKDSVFSQAGGPAIITDHHGIPDDDDVKNDSTGKLIENSGFNTDGQVVGRPTNLDIINSTIESHVAGDEPWFTVYGATALTTMLLPGYEQAMNAGQKSIYVSESTDAEKTPLLNLVAVMKAGGTQGLTGARLGGYIRIFDSESDYNKFYALNGETQETTTYGLDMTHPTNSLAVQAMATFNGEFGSACVQSYSNGASMVLGVSQTATGAFYEGKYNNCYIFNGMGMICEIGNKAS